MKIRKSGGFIPHRSGAGFTLIELLIAITIITVLSIIGLVTYSDFLKNSRNAKRQADLKFIQSALEAYHADQIFYPSTITGGSPLTNLTGRPAPTPLPSTKPYLNSVPSDPMASPHPQYHYQAFPSSPIVCDNDEVNCTSYCLYTKLENTSDSNLSGCGVLTDYNFAVTTP